MLYYLIQCRSLTYAQRTAGALEGAGIAASVLRSPRAMGGTGCSHSVRVAQRHLLPALQVLRQAGLDPEHIFVTAGDGNYQEVEL